MTAKLLGVFAEDCGEVVRIHLDAKHIGQRTGNELQQQPQHGYAILSGIQIIEILRITNREGNHLHIHVQLTRTVLTNDLVAVLERILLIGERLVVIAELFFRKGEE